MHNVPQHWAVNCVEGRVGIKDVDVDKYKIHQVECKTKSKDGDIYTGCTKPKPIYL